MQSKVEEDIKDSVITTIKLHVYHGDHHIGILAKNSDGSSVTFPQIATVFENKLEKDQKAFPLKIVLDCKCWKRFKETKFPLKDKRCSCPKQNYFVKYE